MHQQIILFILPTVGLGYNNIIGYALARGTVYKNQLIRIAVISY